MQPAESHALSSLGVPQGAQSKALQPARFTSEPLNPGTGFPFTTMPLTE